MVRGVKLELKKSWYSIGTSKASNMSNFLYRLVHIQRISQILQYFKTQRSELETYPIGHKKQTFLLYRNFTEKKGIFKKIWMDFKNNEKVQNTEVRGPDLFIFKIINV